MEANNDNDKLDKFVRDAFEGYEELPSGGMWDRIDAGLPPQRWSWARYRWSAAAACAIVLLASGLIGQHLYYKDKIQTLSKAHPAVVEKQAAPEANSVSPLPENLQKIDNPAHKHNTSGEAVDQASAVDLTSERKTHDAVVGKDAPDLPGRVNLPQDTRNQKTSNRVNFFGERRAGVAPGLEQDKAVVVPHGRVGLRPGNTPPLSLPNEMPMVDNAPNELLSAPASIAENAIATPPAAQPNKIFSGMEALPNGAFLTLEKEASVAALPLPLPNLIKPSRTPSGWYLGLQVAPSWSMEKIPEPDHSALPPWGGGPRKPNVVNERESTAYTTDVWLKAGKKINRRLAIESGIGFRSITEAARHKPAFEFRDGHPQGGGPHGGGGHPKCFDFNYQLDAYGGTASVSLRMTQVDSAISIADKEPIGLEITTIQRTQLLKIPLLVALNAGNGRLKGVLKVGLIGNFVLKNELDIEGLSSLNKKFSPDFPSKPKPDFATPKKFIPGYWASAAVEYRLSRHWSALIEPTITGDFPAQTNFGRALPRDVSAALHLGLQYYF